MKKRRLPSAAPRPPRAKALAATSLEGQLARIQAGLGFVELERLRRALDLTRDKLASVLGISRATLHRRQARRRLDVRESEKVVRFQRLLDQSVTVFGDRASARAWLHQPQPALGNAIPLEFARTELGAREVENLLGRIEYGVYS